MVEVDRLLAHSPVTRQIAAGRGSARAMRSSQRRLVTFCTKSVPLFCDIRQRDALADVGLRGQDGIHHHGFPDGGTWS